MEDLFKKSQPDKEGKSKQVLSLFDIEMRDCIAAPVHASLTEEHLVGLNSDQGRLQ
jgi:hypothetical protein